MADMFHQATAGQKSVTRVVALTVHFVHCGFFHLNDFLALNLRHHHLQILFLSLKGEVR